MKTKIFIKRLITLLMWPGSIVVLLGLLFYLDSVKCGNGVAHASMLCVCALVGSAIFSVVFHYLAAVYEWLIDSIKKDKARIKYKKG